MAARIKDLAWAAGFFDGEGSITLTVSEGKYIRLEVACSQKVQLPLALFERMFGGSVYGYTPKHGEICFVWKIYGAKGVEFLKELYPYMIVKDADAKEVIDIWESKDCERAIKRHSDRQAVRKKTHLLRAGEEGTENEIHTG